MVRLVIFCETCSQTFASDVAQYMHINQYFVMGTADPFFGRFRHYQAIVIFNVYFEMKNNTLLTFKSFQASGSILIRKPLDLNIIKMNRECKRISERRINWMSFISSQCYRFRWLSKDAIKSCHKEFTWWFIGVGRRHNAGDCITVWTILWNRRNCF